jgi:hypothetical protein
MLVFDRHLLIFLPNPEVCDTTADARKGISLLNNFPSLYLNALFSSVLSFHVLVNKNHVSGIYTSPADSKLSI